jgi:large subunit ribosomal protein L17
MRHLKKGRKLNRTSAHRNAMLKNLAASLIEHERIQTTTPKAKELRPFIEPLITFAKRGDLHARRLVIARLGNPAAVSKLFGELAERFKDRPGGYVRIMHLGRRQGDHAPMSVIEFVDAAEATVFTESISPPAPASIAGDEVGAEG